MLMFDQNRICENVAIYNYVYLPIKGSKGACMYIIRTINIPLSSVRN